MKTAQARYDQLKSVREPFLTRARDCSELTIPALIPREGHNGSSVLPTPYQSLGARGVNNLASKLLLALLPPNSPFFRYTVDDFTLQKLAGKEGMRGEVEKALSSVERAIMGVIENEAFRVTTFEGLKHLIVGGNILFYAAPGGGLKAFPLSRYVVKRDMMGNLLEIVVHEQVSPDALPKKFVEQLDEEKGESQTKASTERSLDIYTWIRLDSGRWLITQEVRNTEVPGTRGFYPKGKLPWMALRFTKIDGEDYGRGYVEEYLGDLNSLEGLSQAIVEGAAAAARVLFLVNPNGTTDEKDITDAPNGAVRTGNAEDVSVLQVDKFGDFRVARETIENIEQRLAFAFLMNTSVQRNGERVTAEEIRFMAGELEDALGGVYSILSQEFQLPLVNVILARLQSQQRLPPLPKELVKPTITTGLAALGRGHDLTKLQTLIQMLQPLGPEFSARYINGSELAKRAAAGVGVDPDGLIRTDEEVQAAEQAAAQQAQAQGMIEKLGPKAIDAMRDQMKPGAGPA